jgi:hypothetical protein
MAEVDDDDNDDIDGDHDVSLQASRYTEYEKPDSDMFAQYRW